MSIKVIKAIYNLANWLRDRKRNSLLDTKVKAHKKKGEAHSRHVRLIREADDYEAVQMREVRLHAEKLRSAACKDLDVDTRRFNDEAFVADKAIKELDNI